MSNSEESKRDMKAWVMSWYASCEGGELGGVKERV